jgi:hypothetical protein
MALGNPIFVDWIDAWHQEGEGIGVNVNWIHTKFMLIDPLGPRPAFRPISRQGIDLFAFDRRYIRAIQYNEEHR